MSITGSVSMSVGVQDRRTIGANSVETNVGPGVTTSWTIGDGTGANQGNRTWHARRTIPGGGNDDLDLAGGLTDVQTGAAVTFISIISIIVSNRSSTNTITIGGGTNAVSTMLGATSALTLRPGGAVAIHAPDATGYAITAATADILRIAGTAGQSYDIAIVGRAS